MPPPPKSNLEIALLVQLCRMRLPLNAFGINLELSQVFLQSLKRGLIVESSESPLSESRWIPGKGEFATL